MLFCLGHARLLFEFKEYWILSPLNIIEEQRSYVHRCLCRSCGQGDTCVLAWPNTWLQPMGSRMNFTTCAAARHDIVRKMRFQLPSFQLPGKGALVHLTQPSGQRVFQAQQPSLDSTARLSPPRAGRCTEATGIGSELDIGLLQQIQDQSYTHTGNSLSYGL